ncbi:ABC transporter permease [Lapidilactobacillus wuchangensis]|uniref:ABC transporter permease n=1 Tax=Lapidilactobacillus wuchangensis TaxID=2486001 RepID=UPI000F799AD9|nr:hypothetical protein [Lapidilactobacillus wuchangensis]
MLKENFAQTGALLKINLRRDWVKLLTWFLILVGLLVGYAYKIGTLFSGEKAMATLVATLRTPAMIAIMGYIPDQPAITEAIIYSSEMVVFMSLFAGLASLLISVGATRGAEEEGLVELLRAKAVGQQAFIAAAWLENLLLNGLLFLTTGVGLQFAAMTGANAAGNWLLAALIAGSGLVFGSIGILAAQLTREGRTATSYSLAALGLAYLLRMVIDVRNHQYNWWSLLGWPEQAGVYYHNNWWPVVWQLLAIVVVLVAAMVLNAQRDLNGGLIAVRAGKTTSRFLRGPLTALIKTDQRSFWAWLIGAVVIGMMYGSIFNHISAIIAANPLMQQIVSAGRQQQAVTQLILNFMTLLSVVMAVLGTIRGQMLANHLYLDARQGYLELYFARPVSRLRVFSSYLGWAILNAWLVLAAGILGLYLGSAAVMKQPLALKYFIRIFSGYFGPVAVLVIFSALLLTWAPRWRQLGLVYTGIGFGIMYFHSLLKLPTWVMELVPYGWVRQVPVKTVSGATILSMIVISLVGLGLAYWGYRQRDQNFN